MNDQAPLHGSAFAYGGSGCLILGASGTGKSRITAEALMMGAKLIGDDRIVLQPLMGMVAAAAAPEIAGVIELRGLGLLRMNDTLGKHVLHLVIELDPTADERLPRVEKRQFLGVDVPYLRMAPAPYASAAMILLYLKAMQEGRVLPADWKPKAA
jgi:HPr kinase/phosphorylase